MKNKIDTSRRKTPWDFKTNNTLLENFIKDEYHENYRLKHKNIKNSQEYLIINDIEITNCRWCDSSNIIKRGKDENKIQRYYCYSCLKSFSPISNTIFQDHKISIS